MDITEAKLGMSNGIQTLWGDLIDYFGRKDAGIYLLFAENSKGLVAQGTATVERELPQGTIQDLARGMTIFISKTGIEQAKLQEIQDFVNAYKLAQEIHTLHVQLESAAHPDFQVVYSQLRHGLITNVFVSETRLASTSPRRRIDDCGRV